MAAIDKPVDYSDDSDNDTLVHSLTDNHQTVLEDEEQIEKLLGKHARRTSLREKSTSRRKTKRRERHTGKDEATNLVSGMEEGFKDDSSTSSDSIDLNRKEWKNTPSTKKRTCIHLTLIACCILVLFLLMSYAAYRASRKPSAISSKTFSNGTHMFGATTILISLDGFRADFLQRKLTPSLNALIRSGVSPKYMLPSFPTVTFPNHYTLVTGLYPESHGIVSNQFWDPVLQEEFYYRNVTNSMQPKWWSSAEPIWVSAEKQRIKTAIHMWPGSEAHILGIEPTYLDKYQNVEALPRKVDRILELLDLDQSRRPQLIAAYVPDVDRDGHRFGPNSTEIRGTIVRADNMISLLLEGLLQRNLTEVVNIVVVSDHGMATMSRDRMVQLDDLIDMNLIDHIDGWPLRGLRLKDPARDLALLHEQLLAASRIHQTFDVYTLETMPARYHFSNNLRIAPLWIVPKIGHLVIEKASFDIAKAIAEDRQFDPIGAHGFDHEDPLMRAIFIARGPAFPHEPNSRVPVFQNIEVYNIVCDSLGIEPHSNNGTLRLPLTTQGLHSDFDDDEVTPDDPAPLLTTSSMLSIETGVHTTSAASGSPVGSSTTIVAVPTSAVISVAAPVPTFGAPVENETKESTKNAWLKYLQEQLQKAKDWAKQFLDSVKNNHPDTNTSDVT